MMLISIEKFFGIFGIILCCNFALTIAQMPSTSTCSKFQWRCDNGQCIEGHQQCDGEVNCRDSSDETAITCRNVVCRSYEFRCTYGACVIGTAECNKIRECADNSDETTLNCPGAIPDIDLSGNCTKFVQYQCDSGQCISTSDLCDGVKHCTDGSDETEKRCLNQYCPQFTFRCAYGACIEGDAKCDHHIDCADGSDETMELCGFTVLPVQPVDENHPILTTTPTPIPPGSCVVPEIPENGRIVHAADPTVSLIQGQPIGEGEPIKYKCFNKYVLIGNEDNYCFGGLWVDKTPSCRKYCDHLPLNKISIKASCTINGTAVSCKQPLPPLTRVTMSCRIGYRQPDRPLPDVIICDKSGEWNTYPWKCDEACGVPTPDQIPFIVGGQQTEIRKVPWQVGIYSKVQTKDWEFICGGSIISSRLVVSAAHCFWNDFNMAINNASSYLVTAGKTYRDLNATEATQSQSFSIEKIITREEYQDADGLYIADLAVLVLTDFIIFKPYIAPVCIDFRAFGNERIVPTGVQGIISGWGKTDPNAEQGSEVLQVLDLSAVDYPSCKKASPPTYVKFITGDKICAGHLTGRSVCQGDSGGGLIFPRDVGGTPTYFLHGVVSSGASKQGVCDHTRYTLFTDIQIYIKMISDPYHEYLT